jgi:hypothetical protein
MGFQVSGFRFRAFAATLAGKAAGLIEIETNEHRTLNVQHRILYSVNLNSDGFVKSPKTVMPDLIPVEDGISDRHPESIEITGFLLDSIRDLPE